MPERVGYCGVTNDVVYTCYPLVQMMMMCVVVLSVSSGRPLHNRELCAQSSHRLRLFSHGPHLPLQCQCLIDGGKYPSGGALMTAQLKRERCAGCCCVGGGGYAGIICLAMTFIIFMIMVRCEVGESEQVH
jgi:hypothetical protein